MSKTSSEPISDFLSCSFARASRSRRSRSKSLRSSPSTAIVPYVLIAIWCPSVEVLVLLLIRRRRNVGLQLLRVLRILGGCAAAERVRQDVEVLCGFVQVGVLSREIVW